MESLTALLHEVPHSPVCCFLSETSRPRPHTLPMNRMARKWRRCTTASNISTCTSEARCINTACGTAAARHYAADRSGSTAKTTKPTSQTNMRNEQTAFPRQLKLFSRPSPCAGSQYGSWTSGSTLAGVEGNSLRDGSTLVSLSRINFLGEVSQFVINRGSDRLVERTDSLFSQSAEVGGRFGPPCCRGPTPKVR